MVHVGYDKRIRYKKFIGYKYCRHCERFADYYLAKYIYSFSLNFIPFLQITENRYIMCTYCENGYVINKKEYKELKKKYKNFFNRSECSQHFDYIKQLCKGLKNDEYNVINVYQQINKRYHVDEFEEHYVQVIKDVLAYEYNYV